MRIPLVGQSYEDRSLAVGAQATINCFPGLIQDPQEQAKNKAVLYGTPGKHLHTALTGLGLGDVRGLWSGAGRLFVAAGKNLLEVDSTGTVLSNFAYAATDDGLPVQIFSNGLGLMLITGGFAYYDPGTGPVAITFGAYNGTVTAAAGAQNIVWQSGDQFNTDGTWAGQTITIDSVTYTILLVATPQVLYLTAPIVSGVTNAPYSMPDSPVSAVSGAYLDGTFFVQRPPTVGQTNYGRQVNYSPLYDNSGVWNGLNFFSKESYPDNLRGLHVDNEQLYLMGAESGEIWQSLANPGINQNPFARLPGATFRYGMASPWTMDSLDGNVFFLGTDDRGGYCAFAMNGGFAPVRISTHAEESQWNSGAFPWVNNNTGSAAVTYGYQEEGHSFWVVNFGPQTWVYEPETGAWHQRYGWSGSALIPYQTNLHTYIPEWLINGQQGVHVTAGTNSGASDVFLSNINFYDDNGTDMIVRRALPYLYAGGLRQFFGRITLEMETGTAASGTPTITLDYSDDRGVTWVNPRAVPTGVTSAQSGLRVWWNRNGSSRGRIYRLTIIGQSKVVLIDLQADIVLGTS